MGMNMPRQGRQPGATMVQQTKDKIRRDAEYWRRLATHTQEQLARAEKKLQKTEKTLSDLLEMIKEQPPAPRTKSWSAFGNKAP
jgi:hypothetical protein